MNQTLIQLIWIVLALGLPASTTALAFKATNDPRSALAVCVATLIVEVLFGFITKVWQKWESKWVDRAVDWLDTKVLSLFSGYRRRYFEYITYQHRGFDVKGLGDPGIYTLELERVYVQLRIDTTSIHRATADPIKTIPAELRSSSRTIWEYIQSPSLSTQHFAIIGAPGSGKTTLLKHMALILASSPHRRRRRNIPDRIPILLFLRDYATAIETDPNLSLAQMVRDQLAKWQAPPPTPGWLENHLDEGHCLVMLDGLDEVADPKVRRKVVTWVEQIMVAHGKNRFVISSRPYGYRDNPISGVTVLQVLHFTHKQIEDFVQGWYLANEIMSYQKDDPGVHASARQGADDLLARIRNTPALSDLAVNPLLLTMISTIHRFTSTLPGRRVELYKEICETFLGKRRAASGLELDLTPVQKQRVLQPLAYYMMSREKREIASGDAIRVIMPSIEAVCPEYSPQAFLQMIENSSGLLLERESGVYSFAHKTFQEYLAATVVCEYRSRLESQLAAQVNNGWWHETIRLYCAQTNASTVIAACLAAGQSSSQALALAIACMDEAGEVDPAVRRQYETSISSGAEDTDPERRRVVAEALLSLRLQRMIRINDELWIDSAPITSTEYQLFLEANETEKTFRPDHWLTRQPPPEGGGKTPIVGVRFSDARAFCDWLTRHGQSDWAYRLPTREEASSYPTSPAADSVGYWVYDPAGSQGFVHQSGPSVASLDVLRSIFHGDYSLACMLAGQIRDVLPKYHRNALAPLFKFFMGLPLKSKIGNQVSGLAKVLGFSLDSFMAGETTRQAVWSKDLDDSLDIDFKGLLVESKAVPDVLIPASGFERTFMSIISQHTSLDLDYFGSVTRGFRKRVVHALALKSHPDLLVISALERFIFP